ncbi:MAG TPA: N-acetylglucosamine-6-phosphate deacetylase [Chthoniobacteraceae bacterium]|jgi:N-acetylglucosamine-6-phosphate deacetylase
MILRSAHLVHPDRIEARRDVRVLDGKIAEIGQGLAASAGEEILELTGQFLAPGFIDLHIHGALRRDTMEATPEAFETICRHHAAGGTTALALTTVTATLDEMLTVLKAVAAFREQETGGSQVLGVHLEGPYFSLEKPGAHRRELIRNPRPEEYLQLLEYKSLITQITLAPELPGALELIETFQGHGIRVSGGHSDAWDEEAAAAQAHGMRQVTHTFNCMSSARRRGPYRAAGLLEFAMSEPEILCELIADGRHVSPTLMRMLYQAKGPDGIVLISDATAGAGLGEEEPFQLAEISCVVRDGVGLTADGSALAGSTASMIDCVRNMVQLVGVSLPEAVRMATLNPARALRLEEKKGLLCKGADADLVAFTEDFTVSRTIVGGRTVARPVN